MVASRVPWGSHLTIDNQRIYVIFYKKTYNITVESPHKLRRIASHIRNCISVENCSHKEHHSSSHPCFHRESTNISLRFLDGR